MRYYKIIITKKDGSVYLFKSCGNAFASGITATSLLPSGPQTPQAGLTNPAALLIEFDCAQYNGADPDTNGYFRIWGLGLADLGNASDLNGLSIAVYAGMAKGLPLANPAQAGLILQGEILQAFGNWQGTAQTLDMIFAVGGQSVTGGSPAGAVQLPGNYPFSMPAGTTLAKAIANTLSVALPDMPPTINISPNLVLNYDQVGHYPSLTVFASFVKALSVGIMGDNDYPGVTIASDGATISVFDGTGSTTISGTNASGTITGTKSIAFSDLIGQPVWIGPALISFKCVLRADIHMGDVVTLPKTLFTQSNAAPQRFAAQPQNSLTFSGNFLIQQVHFYGNSRQPDAASWNTTYQAAQVITS